VLREKLTKNQKTTALILTILAGVLWGTSFPAIKIGLQQLDAYTFVFLRFLVASLVMLAALAAVRKVNFRLPRKRLILLLGIVNGVAYLMQYAGMEFTSAAKASLLVNLSIIWVAILSPFLLKEHLGWKKAIGVTVSLLGVFFMTTNLSFSSLEQGTIVGDVLVIGAGIAWAVFILYSKPLATDGKNRLQSMTLLLLFTLMSLLPAFLFSAGSIASVGAIGWLMIFYTAVFCWVVPYYLWMKGLEHLSPVTSAVVLLTEIIVAVTVATLFLGEAFTFISGIGAILIVVAIIMVS
jgi:drug/metabolite transporter (DMT)-like permease